MKRSEQTVVVLGASDKPDRTSNRAVRHLQADGYRVIPVHPSLETIEGLAVKHRLAEIQESVDTLTVYLSPVRSTPMTGELVRMRPGRVILNPGTESDQLESSLGDAGIPCIKACTLVMLSTGRF
jgi:predicted CoA-binding protein